jgi:hypothetical protein
MQFCFSSLQLPQRERFFIDAPPYYLNLESLLLMHSLRWANAHAPTAGGYASVSLALPEWMSAFPSQVVLADDVVAVKHAARRVAGYNEREVMIASGATLQQANELMVRLHELGVISKKQRD